MSYRQLANVPTMMANVATERLPGGRVARLLLDPIGAASRKFLPSTIFNEVDPKYLEQFSDPVTGNITPTALTTRSYLTVPASLAAYGMGIGALIPDAPTPTQQEEQAYVYDRLTTMSPGEVELLRQQALFAEQQRLEKEAVKESIKQQIAQQQYQAELANRQAAYQQQEQLKRQAINQQMGQFYAV